MRFEYQIGVFPVTLKPSVDDRQRESAELAALLTRMSAAHWELTHVILVGADLWHHFRRPAAASEVAGGVIVPAAPEVPPLPAQGRSDQPFVVGRQEQQGQGQTQDDQYQQHHSVT
jgi:hypothetical protein